MRTAGRSQRGPQRAASAAREDRTARLPASASSTAARSRGITISRPRFPFRHSHKFWDLTNTFPLPVKDFMLATARLLAARGLREEVRVIAAQATLPTPSLFNFDNWDGGQWGWRVDLTVPVDSFQALQPADRETMESRIGGAMAEVLKCFDGHTVDLVRITMRIPSAPPEWQKRALAWADGAGTTNQGRARSTNIAPLEEDGLLFRSHPEIFLYRALKRSGLAVAPLPVFIQGGDSYRRLEPDFVIVHAGRVMVVEVDGETFHTEAPVDAHERLVPLSREGVYTERVRASDCDSDAKASECVTHLVSVLKKLVANR